MTSLSCPAFTLEYVATFEIILAPMLRNALLPALVLILVCGCTHFENRPLVPSATAEALETRSLSDARFRLFLETNLHHHVDSWPHTNWDFETLTLAAFYFHPGLDLARAQWASSHAGVETAAGRLNPILSVAPGYSANPPKGISPWFPIVTLDVPIETAGKRGYRIAHGEHLSAAARLNVITSAWQVRTTLRGALLDYVVAQNRAALLEQNLRLEQQLLTVLEQRLAAGAAAAPEIIPQRLRLLRVRTDVLDAQRVAMETRGRLAEAIGVPLRALDGAQVSFEFHDEPPLDLTASDVRRTALQGRADVLAALAEYEASQSALQLEIAKQYPDLHFNPGYQYDQGENKWSLGLSVELPLLNRNQGPIAEAEAKRKEAAARFVVVQARVIAELDRAQLARASAHEQLRQAEELIRLTHEQLAQLERSFNAGAADQFDLATARVEAATADVARLDAAIKVRQAAGLLEDALQRPFDALSTVEHDPKTQVAKDAP